MSEIGIDLYEMYESDIKNILKAHDPDVYEYFQERYIKKKDIPECSIAKRVWMQYKEYNLDVKFAFFPDYCDDRKKKIGE